MKLFLFVACLLFPLASLIAQEDTTNYQRAIRLIDQGTHDEAMELLRPYLDEERYGNLSGYARYHFARAAYENRQYELAKNVLAELLERSAWERADEARYLLALTHFQLSAPSEALRQVDAIRDESLKREAHEASYEFLKVSSSSLLSLQYAAYPENLGLVMALKEKLESQRSLSSSEQEIYQEIRNAAYTQMGNGDKIAPDEVLDVAVVLPFNYDGGSGVNSLQKNNFVLQLYQGIMMAFEEAKARGVAVNFQTFDTERSAEKVSQILRDPFLRKADVILGPIYPEETAEVAAFAQIYEIPQINPLSNIDDNIRDFRYSYLFRPSVQALSQKVIDYCRRFEGNRVALAYSGASRDEQLAGMFTEMARRSGLEIVNSQKLSTRETREFFETLGLGNEEGASVDVIVIFSDDPNIASPTFALVESLESGIPVVVMESWLYFNFANYEMMESQNFHFVGNNTVDFTDEKLTEFRERFLEKFNEYPSSFVYMGYDLTDMVCRVINAASGFDFQENLNRKGFQEGNLTFGFDFSNVKYNNYVPILRLEEGVLTIEEE
ncbi:ABC-type branched-chain amino acid transport system, substrate-binding protein [Cyclobacterium xiamenense]|uniref:ABC-type branched-chain amino acid transport system, substrate-binding protein n=1 Tax=Cyclobacterium xiamenense TaxID=1297121 RepID=A0A1H6Y3B5_9BACT|nr:ABC transporter substrate-binding protein [Cyclobacterium xiamenense]SEJ34384.1 ABC-type branched-chain amino acid transport system, substrate-binding protein [Cyclobacterium xiamenense]